MSTTPRTDAECIQIYSDDVTGCSDARDYVDASFARTLETELACEKENRNHLIEKGAKLETELTAASQAYDCAMAIHGTVLEDLAAEREQVRVLREALALAAESGELTGWYLQQARAALAATKEDSR